MLCIIKKKMPAKRPKVLLWDPKNKFSSVVVTKRLIKGLFQGRVGLAPQLWRLLIIAAIGIGGGRPSSARSILLLPPPPPPSDSTEDQGTESSKSTENSPSSATTPSTSKASTNSSHVSKSVSAESQKKTGVSSKPEVSMASTKRSSAGLSRNHQSFGLFAAGKLGGAYRTLAQPLISEPIKIDPGHFMIAGFQLAWLPRLRHSDKMLVRIGLDYHSSLNLKLEELYPDGSSSKKPIRHQWLSMSLAWMNRRNKKRLTYAIGLAAHYEVRMVYSEVKLVIPNYRVHVPFVSLPMLFSGAKEKVRFEISPQFAVPLADSHLQEHLQPKMRLTVGGDATLFIRLYRRLGMTLNYRETFAFIGSASYFDHSQRIFSFGLAYDDLKLRPSAN